MSDATLQDMPLEDLDEISKRSLENPNSVLGKALADDKQEGLRLSVRSRTIALTIIAIFIPFLNPTISVLYYEAMLVLFALIGWAQLKVGKVGRSKSELFLMGCDLALMTFVVIVPNPFSWHDWPTALVYQQGNFIYFFVLLAGATLSYSWRTIIAMGVWTTGLWTVGVIWTAYQPAGLPEVSAAIYQAVNGDLHLWEILDPNNARIPNRVQEILVFLIVAGILALGGWRANRLLIKQAGAERGRANLARYFSPNIVNRLAERDEPLGAVRNQKVAVLFADIVGFTRIAENQHPDAVIEMLREFHNRMEMAVFDHHGTLDKFLGDGLMATFGTPEASEEDAVNAISSAKAMLESIEGWNEERQKRGEIPIKLSVGIHYGDVIVGDLGSARRMEFAVIGDTVNVASRLEAITRELGTQLVISDELAEAARAEAEFGTDSLLEDFSRGAEQPLRGRDEPIKVWTLTAES